MAEKTYKIDLSLGFKTFEIKFKEFEEPVYIQFNPADEDLPKRLFEAQKMIDEKTEKIKEYSVDENGIPNTDEYIQTQDEINKAIYDAIDYAFGNKISEQIFKHCSPVAKTDGKLFVLQFIEKISPILEKIVKDETKKANAHIDKYYSKYAKK